MSINSFFKTRKSRNINSIESNQLSAKKDDSVVSQFAVQAPQPIYDQLTKPKVIEETVCKKSILYYLSPVKKNVKTETEETTLPCRIRTNIPVSLLWKDILEEFDSDSTFSVDSVVKQDNEIMSICPRIENKRRMLHDNDTRNVRIRTRTNPILLKQSMPLEEYLLEDVGEDLSRPLRTQYNLNQTNAFFLEIIDEAIILSDNRWFIESLYLNK